MKRKSVQAGSSALDLIEDAVHLLRTAPARVLLAYYAGAIPFALGLLYFWADMSCGAFARQRCPAAALGMALLFLWLKCWQAGFASALRARLAAAPAPKWNGFRVLRLLLVQGIVQPTRLFLLPLAFIATIPFPWVLAFFENVTALGDGADANFGAVTRQAGAQARLWPRQNFLLCALLALVAAVLWLNAFIAVLTVPQLLKLFLGLETAFTRAGAWVIFNTTFLAVTLALAWLAFDPLLKAVYVLRCFQGQARLDGADLLAELSQVRARSQSLAVAALLLLAGLPLSVNLCWSAEHQPGQIHGIQQAGTLPGPDLPRFTNPPSAVLPPRLVTSPPTNATATSATVPPSQIDDAVKQTLQHDKYAWRLPRQKAAEDESPFQAWLRSFFSSIGNTLAGWAHTVAHWFRSVLDWIDRHFRPKPKPVDDGAAQRFDWTGLLRWFAYALLAFAVAALVLLAARLWRQGWRRSHALVAEVVPARPDLNDENVTAAQLPEDEWLKLAGEVLRQGDLRLALRAFYLASLAHLAAREIVSLARFKSNHDYENEVNRRARGSPDLRAAFAENVGAFDRAWYGLYDVTADGLAQFQANFQRIRSC